MSDLLQRLRGNYAIRVNDGAGPLNGSDTFKRSFGMPPICGEAADEIERLRAELEKCRALYALRLRERASEDVRIADAIARYERAKSEIERLRAEVEDLRLNRCSDMHEELLAEQRQRLKAESELTALRKRVEEAEVVTIQKMPGSAFGVYVLSPEWVGKHVRLVVEE